MNHKNLEKLHNTRTHTFFRRKTLKPQFTMDNSGRRTQKPASDDESFRQDLEAAQRAGDMDELRKLFREKQEVPAWANLGGRLQATYSNAVMQAVAGHNLSKVESLLSEWSSHSTVPGPLPDNLNWSLSRAIEAGNRPIVKVLIQYGARAGYHSRFLMLVNNPILADDETLEGIFQDLLEAGWHLNGSSVLAYVFYPT